MKKSYDNVMIDEMQFDSMSDFLKEISITGKLYDELGGISFVVFLQINMGLFLPFFEIRMGAEEEIAREQ